MPVITANGHQVAPVLYAGGLFRGGFTGVYGAEDSNGSANILQLNSWEGYKALLEDGSYKDNAYTL